MWRNPQVATDVFVSGMLSFYAQHPTVASVRIETLPDQPTYRLMCDWLNQINDRYSRTYDDETSFRKWYHNFIVKEAKKIEKHKLYDSLSEMTVCILQTEEWMKTFTELAPVIRDFWSVLSPQIMLLVGTESRMLVGTRDNLPAWRQITPLKKSDIPLAMMKIIFTNYSCLRHVGQDDAWMVPMFHEFDVNVFREHNKNSGYTDVTKELIETAFYKQRYVIDPAGVYVEITDVPGITGLYIKVKSRSSSELADILVRIEAVDGVLFTVLTETALLNDGFDVSYFQPGSYLTCLIAQIYHDLVTASEPRSGNNPTDLREICEHSADVKPSWRVIPRRVNNVAHEPRTRIPERAITEPHRVTGHLRKARMTDNHREELKQFELETGLQVLRFIPDGYTFVRPHVSPRTSHEDIATLPRFIRHRIQQTLEAKLKEKGG